MLVERVWKQGQQLYTGDCSCTDFCGWLLGKERTNEGRTGQMWLVGFYGELWRALRCSCETLRKSALPVSRPLCTLKGLGCMWWTLGMGEILRSVEQSKTDLFLSEFFFCNSVSPTYRITQSPVCLKQTLGLFSEPTGIHNWTAVV